MTQPYKYKPKKKVDHFELLEQKTVKPKIKFEDISLVHNEPEIKVIKKKHIETPYIRKRRMELMMIKDTLENLQINRDFIRERKEEYVVETRRKEIMQIKELLIAEVKASSVRIF